ncbi:MAG: Rnf-Nqr domain containing protein [Pseudomonadota bacterium]|nr:Rnf-Nqr domain containing protein [Pseudomonadota bacterium]
MQELNEVGLTGLVVAAMLTNNIVLSQFLGLCPFIGVSNHTRNARGLAVATTLVLTLVAGLTQFIYSYLLAPFHLEFLKTLVLIFVIAASVQILELFIKQISPLLHQSLGVFLPLITSNCAVLGVALLVVNQQFTSVLDASIFGLGAGAGFALVLLLLSQLRHKIAFAKAPLPFRGTPLGLITAAIMSMAFMGFSGL